MFQQDQIIPLIETTDLNKRLDPGSEVPAGECPKCYCLVYLIRTPKQIVVEVSGGVVQQVWNVPDGVELVIVDKDNIGTVIPWDELRDERDECSLQIFEGNSDEAPLPYHNFSPKHSALDNFDNHQAFIEGWALFNDGEIQRLDEPADRLSPVFESDKEAIAFVREQAAKGSDYHKLALQLSNLSTGRQ